MNEGPGLGVRLTIEQAAVRAGVCVRTIHRWRQLGLIGTVKVGRFVRIARTHVWVQCQATLAPSLRAVCAN
jgi:excisionase family DNA binding protein